MSIVQTKMMMNDVGWMTTNKMKMAKKMIDEFKEKFTFEMERETGESVYTLMVNFFPSCIQPGECCD